MLKNLLPSLRQMFISRTREVQTAHNRTLPLGELVVDRWEKARLLGFGEGANLYDSVLVYGDVHVGCQSWIGPHVILDGAGAPLRIGEWCNISAGTHIYTHNTIGWVVTGGACPRQHAPVTVGSRVYIGPQSVVAMGVSIGDGSVIGACSFVNSDIPAGTIAWGQPATVRGKVCVDEDNKSYHILYNDNVHSKLTRTTKNREKL